MAPKSRSRETSSVGRNGLLATDARGAVDEENDADGFVEVPDEEEVNDIDEEPR